MGCSQSVAITTSKAIDIPLYVYHFVSLQVYLMDKFPEGSRGKSVFKFSRYRHLTLHREPIHLNSYQPCLRVLVLPTQYNLTTGVFADLLHEQTVSLCAPNF